MSIEAMTQALEALYDSVSDNSEWIAKRENAVTSLRQAIEAAEKQEPYGYFKYDMRLDAWVKSRDTNSGIAFYTHPPKREWVSLTKQEIDVEALKDDYAAYFALGAIWANKRLQEKNGC